MFRLNKIKYLILILFSFLLVTNVDALVNPTSKFYINDYANILSEETEEYILNRSVALDNVDGTQIVVVTVPNLEGNSIEDYSLQLFRNFGIGDSQKNNGLLLLLALEEREFRVEVGYGLEGILPDGKTGRFQDEYMIPYLRQNKWDEGIKNGYDAFYSEIVKLNDLEIDYNNPIENNSNSYTIESEMLIVIGILFMFSPIIGIVSGLLIKKSNKSFELTIAYFIIWFILISLFSSFSFFLIINIMFFIATRFFSSNSVSVGGSNSGRSSFGGRSFSSGRSFSGRGGSSGGGGSSRRF